MRKILFYIIALTSVVSCLNGTSYSSSYQVLATFDYGDAKFRSDSTFYVSAENIGIGWNYLAFCHKVDASGDFLGGFRLSCLEGQIKENADGTAPQAEGEALPLDMTWRVNTVPEANNYMVFWDSGDMPESHILFMNPTNGKCTMALCYVCNTAKVAEEVKSKFERGDKLILKATGFLAKSETGSAEIALADYTQNDKNGTPKDSIMSRWTQFDLEKLGMVDEVRFEIIDENNKILSKYFCLDNLSASISLEY